MSILQRHSYREASTIDNRHCHSLACLQTSFQAPFPACVFSVCSAQGLTSYNPDRIANQSPGRTSGGARVNADIYFRNSLRVFPRYAINRSIISVEPIPQIGRFAKKCWPRTRTETLTFCSTAVLYTFLRSFTHPARDPLTGRVIANIKSNESTESYKVSSTALRNYCAKNHVIGSIKIDVERTELGILKKQHQQSIKVASLITC